MNRSSILYECITISHPQYHDCFFSSNPILHYITNICKYIPSSTPRLLFGKYPCIKHYQHLQCMNVQTAYWASNTGVWGELLPCDKTSKWKATITIYMTTVFSHGPDKCIFSDVLIQLTSFYDIFICLRRFAFFRLHCIDQSFAQGSLIRIRKTSARIEVLTIRLPYINNIIDVHRSYQSLLRRQPYKKSRRRPRKIERDGTP